MLLGILVRDHFAAKPRELGRKVPTRKAHRVDQGKIIKSNGHVRIIQLTHLQVSRVLQNHDGICYVLNSDKKDKHGNDQCQW